MSTISDEPPLFDIEEPFPDMDGKTIFIHHGHSEGVGALAARKIDGKFGLMAAIEVLSDEPDTYWVFQVPRDEILAVRPSLRPEVSDFELELHRT